MSEQMTAGMAAVLADVQEDAPEPNVVPVDLGWKPSAEDIVPLYDRILVRQFNEEETFGATGIVRADAHKERPLAGVVLAVGEGKPLDGGGLRALKVRVGDEVMFHRYAGLSLKDLGMVDLLMIREDELLGLRRRDNSGV